MASSSSAGRDDVLQPALAAGNLARGREPQYRFAERVRYLARVREDEKRAAELEQSPDRTDTDDDSDIEEMDAILPVATPVLTEDDRKGIAALVFGDDEQGALTDETYVRALFDWPASGRARFLDTPVARDRLWAEVNWSPGLRQYLRDRGNVGVILADVFDHASRRYAFCNTDMRRDERDELKEALLRTYALTLDHVHFLFPKKANGARWRH